MKRSTVYLVLAMALIIAVLPSIFLGLKLVIAAKLPFALFALPGSLCVMLAGLSLWRAEMNVADFN